MLSISKTLLLLSLCLGIALLTGCAGKQEAQVTVTPEGETTQLPDMQQASHDTAIDTTFMLPQDTMTVPQTQYGWIKNDWVNVRSEPTTSSVIAARLERGSRVELLEEAGDWWNVLLDDGTEAYIHSSLIHFDEYVDPWTKFKMSCRLADTSLKVVSGVSRVDESGTPSAQLLVTDGWYLLSAEQRKLTGQQAFLFWQKCLEEAGYKLAGATLVFHDEDGRELAKVTRSGSGAVDIELTEY